MVQTPTPTPLFMNPMPNVSSNEASRTNPLAFLAKTSPTLLPPHLAQGFPPKGKSRDNQFVDILTDAGVGRLWERIAICLLRALPQGVVERLAHYAELLSFLFAPPTNH